MSQLALFVLPEHAAPALAAVPSEIVDIEREDWTADPDDAYRLAELVCEQAVEDLADLSDEGREWRWDAQCWLGHKGDAPCSVEWCALALGVDVERLIETIDERVWLARSVAYWHRRDVEAAHHPEQPGLPIEDAPVREACRG